MADFNRPDKSTDVSQHEMLRVRAAQKHGNMNRKKSHDFDDNEWVFVHREQELENEDGTRHREELPAETFHGTWSGALTDSRKAAGEVTKASKSYLHAVANSGITRAGWSLGSAIASTANHSALSVASTAIGVTGTDERRLPTGVKTWLQGKKDRDARNQRVKETKKRHADAKVRGSLIKKDARIPKTYSVDSEGSDTGSFDYVSDGSGGSPQNNHHHNAIVRELPSSRRKANTIKGLPSSTSQLEDPPMQHWSTNSAHNACNAAEELQNIGNPLGSAIHSTFIAGPAKQRAGYGNMMTPASSRRRIAQPLDFDTPVNHPLKSDGFLDTSVHSRAIEDDEDVEVDDEDEDDAAVSLGGLGLE